MAMLKDTLVQGDLRVTGNTNLSTLIPLAYGGLNANFASKSTGLVIMDSSGTAYTTLPMSNGVYNIRTYNASTSDYCSSSANQIKDSEYSGTRYIKFGTSNMENFPNNIAGFRRSDATGTNVVVKDVTVTSLEVQNTDKIGTRDLIIYGYNYSTSSSQLVLV